MPRGHYDGPCRDCGGQIEPFSVAKYRCCACAEYRRGFRVRKCSGYCAYCGQFAAHLTRDHIVPKSAGGLSAPENIALVCERCNQLKGSMPLDAWLAYLARESQ